jgi:hypothetical protein
VTKTVLSTLKKGTKTSIGQREIKADTNVQSRAEYIQCIEAHVKHNHLGVMTRLVAGESCGGASACNSVNVLEKIQQRTVLQALDRIAHGALLFIGVTDNWDDSIELFHAMLMPSVPVLSSELQNIHPSTIPSTSRGPAEDLKRQEMSFLRIMGRMGDHDRDLLKNDPDLVLYARTRQLFCANFQIHLAEPRCASADFLSSDQERAACVAAKLPSTCGRDLGPLPSSDVTNKLMLAAAVSVVAHWGLADREDVSAGVISGASLSVEDMFRSMPAASPKAQAFVYTQNRSAVWKGLAEHADGAAPHQPAEHSAAGAAAQQTVGHAAEATPQHVDNDVGAA